MTVAPLGIIATASSAETAFIESSDNRWDARFEAGRRQDEALICIKDSAWSSGSPPIGSGGDPSQCRRAFRPTVCGPPRGGSSTAAPVRCALQEEDLRLHDAAAFEFDPSARNENDACASIRQLWRRLCGSLRLPESLAPNTNVAVRENSATRRSRRNASRMVMVECARRLDCSSRSEEYGRSYARLPANHGAGHWTFDESQIAGSLRRLFWRMVRRAAVK